MSPSVLNVYGCSPKTLLTGLFWFLLSSFTAHESLLLVHRLQQPPKQIFVITGKPHSSAEVKTLLLD